MTGQADSDADIARQEGNEAYKGGDMKSAEVAYTRSSMPSSCKSWATGV